MPSADELDAFLKSISKKPKTEKALEKSYLAILRAAGGAISCPSSKALQATFKIDSTAANKVRKLCKLADSPGALEEFINDHCPETAAYVRKMHSNPYDSRMWRRTVVLDAINHLVDGYGVEPLGPSPDFRSGPPYEYINMGDTYATTLIYKRSSDRLSIGNWGDIVERHPKWE